MTPRCHPPDELLLDYAAGAAREPFALLIASHLVLCPACRAEVAELEALGGTLLDEATPEPLAAGSLEVALARLDEPAPPELPRSRASTDSGEPPLPGPLRACLGGPLAAMPWRRYGLGLRIARLLPGSPGITTRLLRIRGGRALPSHRHEGTELILVLAGAFSDERGAYRRGDVVLADPAIEHRPVAVAGEECLCLVVSDAPIRPSGPLGRLLGPLLRF